MAEIYLFHPKHGVKVASLEIEAQNDELHGWRRCELEDLLPQPEEELPEAPAEDNVMADAPRRRGRPRTDKGD